MVLPAGVLVRHMNSIVIAAEWIVVDTVGPNDHLGGSTTVDHRVAWHALCIKHATKDDTASLVLGSFNHLVHRYWGPKSQNCYLVDISLNS